MPTFSIGKEIGCGLGSARQRQRRSQSLWGILSQRAGFAEVSQQAFLQALPSKNFGVWPHPNCLQKRAALGSTVVKKY